MEAQAEQAYDKMYGDTIGLARRLGQDVQAVRLETRLAHIKAVFRSQFD